MKPAIFLDKDGTLIDDVPYNADPAQIVLAAGAREAAQILHWQGYALIVVTNQSGIARGLFDEAELGAVETKIASLLGVPLTGFYYCPHHPDGRVAEYAVYCECRKPAPGLLFRAANELGIDLGASWMIGDILNDVEAGRRAGCRTILIDNGNETEWERRALRVPDYQVADMRMAADVILGAQRQAA